MSLPKGTIWQEYRAQALDAIPVGCRSSFSKPVAIRNWLKNGYFSIISADNKGFNIETNLLDFGSALFGDAEHLMDHCAEQMVATRSLLTARNGRSTAWSIVTCYYWGFFAVLALGRLVGKVPIYLDRDAVNRLWSYAATPPTTRKPPAGSFVLSTQVRSGSPLTDAKIESKDDRIHELAWRWLFSNIRSLIASVNQSTANREELLLYTSIVESGNLLDDDWPSQIRNLVNYRPGYAYGFHNRVFLQGKNQPDVASAIDGTWQEATRLLDSQLAKLRVNSSRGRINLESDADSVACAVYFLSRLVYLVSRELYDEIANRISSDKRFRVARDNFLKSATLTTPVV